MPAQKTETRRFGPQLPIPINPDNAIIAFDLHRVIMHRTWGAALAYAFKLAWRKKEMLLLALNPIFWIRALYAVSKTRVSDDIYERLVKTYPRLAHFRDDFIALENIQSADPAMVMLMCDLKKRGFTLALFSNIGERAYADMKHKHPELFGLFDISFSPKKEDNYLQKPQPAFFKKFLTFLEHHGYKNRKVLFIDDKKKNLTAAAQAGISSILFKSTEQLRNTLNRML